VKALKVVSLDALVIGNLAYENVDALNKPENDAEAVAASRKLIKKDKCQSKTDQGVPLTCWH
jgi:uncharacterized caspase-like protein